MTQKIKRIPPKERWLYENKEALRMVKAGLRAAKAGKVRKVKVRPE
jgi:hypothetical protein